MSIPFFPGFPLFTRTVWSQRPTLLVDQLQAKAQEMLDADLTMTSTGVEDTETPNGTEFVVLRNWANADAANEWIAFVNGLNSPDLISISVHTIE